MKSAQLLPAIRELYSRRSEYFHHEPWELQRVFYSLNYTDDLADEAEIAATAEAIHRGELSAQTAFIEGRLRLGGDLRAVIERASALAAIDDVFGAARA